MRFLERSFLKEEAGTQRKLVIAEGKNVPAHWYLNSWEEKARENPLYAVMTTPDLLDADPEKFSQEHLRPFFEKGRRVFEKHVLPCIDRAGFLKNEVFLVDYGCGCGRVLRAIVEDRFRCAGVDISETMLRHCKRLVPEVGSLHALDANNRCDLPDGAATTVFSFAVLKHIPALSVYERAVAEVCRVLRPGGTLALNVNSQDFISGGVIPCDLKSAERTENYETYSLHFEAGSRKPYRKRTYSTWSGVYIGIHRLREILERGAVETVDVYHHNLEKPQGIWVIGKKSGECPG